MPGEFLRLPRAASLRTEEVVKGLYIVHGAYDDIQSDYFETLDQYMGEVHADPADRAKPTPPANPPADGPSA